MTPPIPAVDKKAPIFVSATRTRDSFTRPCRHAHPDLLETDKCARKRNATTIVRDLDGRISMAPAPYLRVRRQTQRILKAAESIVLAARTR